MPGVASRQTGQPRFLDGHRAHLPDRLRVFARLVEDHHRQPSPAVTADARFHLCRQIAPAGCPVKAGPATLPKPIVAKLSGLFSDIARTPEMRQKLFQQGWQVAGTSSEGLANRIKSDTNLLGGVIAMRGIKAE